MSKKQQRLVKRAAARRKARAAPPRPQSAMVERPARPAAPPVTVARPPVPATRPEGGPLVSVIMGSRSDWETMSAAAELLAEFGVPYETRIVSAHRTPVLLAEFAAGAEARGIEVIVAGAGGAAHLPGMAAAQTLLPVLGVPIESRALKGLDSLLSIVQMPAGVPVGTLAIGRAGATNAALLAIAILSSSRPRLREKLRLFRSEQTQKVLADRLP